MKKLFKVTFISEEQKPTQLYAEEVCAADILGFVEASRLVFIDSSDVIINPEDDKIRKMFENTTRVMFPINNVLRIEEVTILVMDKNSPIIQIYSNEKNS